jgi:HAE1 family hydrophobic/amphiphilic exporter-1
LFKRQYRALPEDILKLYVNDRDEMVPYSAFMKLEKYMDYQRLLDTICTLRQRLAVLLLRDSSGTAIKVIQVAAEKTTRGYDIDWAGISADEGIKRFGYFLSVWVLCIWF